MELILAAFMYLYRDELEDWIVKVVRRANKLNDN